MYKFFKFIINYIDNLKKSIDGKFINLLNTEDYQVLTNEGYKDFTGVGKTIKYREYILKTKNNELICADDHLVINEFNKPIKVVELKINDNIITKNGLEKIVSIIKTYKFSNMYDLLNVDEKVYFTNNILSHNTTVVSLQVLHDTLYREAINTVILANRLKTANILVRRIKMAFEKLPFYVQLPVKVYNAGRLEFGNDSVIFSNATTETGVSGESINNVVIDEVAKIGSVFPTFWTATQPTLSSATKEDSIRLLLLSTPVGDNYWKHMCESAGLEGTKNWNGFHLQTVTYKDIAERNSETWANKQKMSMSNEEFIQEYEAGFVTFSNILFINGKILDSIKIKEPIKDSKINKTLKKWKDRINVYEKPKDGHRYVIGIDPSEIKSNSVKGEHSNFGIQILDVTNIKKGFKQVLAINFEENFDYLESTLILNFLGEYYNMALIILENNRCLQIGNDLERQYHYENIFYNEKDEIGVKTTKKNKKINANILKTLIENGQLKLKDDDTVFECKKFTKTLKHMKGYSDGMILSLMMAISFLTLEIGEIEALFDFDSENKDGDVYITTGRELLQMQLENSEDDNDDLVSYMVSSDANKYNNTIEIGTSIMF
jgi:hypothetical protein